MNDGRDIERLLSQNSDVNTDLPYSGVATVSPKFPYRPDRVFDRDDLMKWNMVLNAIDTPYRLAPGAAIRNFDRISLKSAIKELADFSIEGNIA